LEQNAEQEAAAEAEKEGRSRAREPGLPAVAWGIQFLKRLGFVPELEAAKDAAVEQVKTFANSNVASGYGGLRILIIPDANGKKNKPELFTALSTLVRVQQPDGHWKNAKGVGMEKVVVPENVRIAAPTVLVPPAVACIPQLVAVVPPTEGANAAASEPCMSPPGLASN